MCQPNHRWDARNSSRESFSVAASFLADGDGIVGSICWWGGYFDGVEDCGGQFPDSFTVTYYDDDAGLPGSVIAGPFLQSTGSLAVAGPALTLALISNTVVEYAYVATHTTASLGPGNLYWAEISNTSQGACNWYWETAGIQRNRSAQDGLWSKGPNGWDRLDTFPDSMAVCVESSLPAEFTFVSPPSNDNCEFALPVNTLQDIPLVSVGATTDGLGRDVSEPVVLASCDFSIGDETVHNDVWFVYEPTCSGNVQIGTCNSDFDTKIIAYPETACPPPYDDAVACNDDACGGSDLALQSQVDVSVRDGERYLVRVGGYRGATGVGTLTLDFVPPSSAKLFDYATLARCFTGSCSTETCDPPIYNGTCCSSADFDGDGDVDLEDYEQLRAALVGP